ncbi:MAG TPA: VacB/RNase II family 3'-5' exoribonuclease, partial [bacterium]
MEGMFSAHPDGYGFVAVGSIKTSLFIPPPEVGGALDGDWVRVELIPARGRHRTAGRVAEVLERRRTRVRGHVEREGRELWVMPLNERVPDVFIAVPKGAHTDQWPNGTLVDVAITQFPEAPEEYPEGNIVAEVTEDESPNQIIDNILAGTSLHLGFSAATHQEMERLGDEPPAPAGKRVDLTHLPFVTIDPVDARDMDDAVCVEPIANGHMTLWVAIADVAAYVVPGSAVDADAYRKGTSVYFPSRVIPMLPEELSGDRCSLRADVPRPAMVCEMEIDPQGEVSAYRIHEATIRSRAKLNYGQVLRYLESGEAAGIPEALLPHITRARELAVRLEQKRERRGALGFAFPEARFELGPDGLPVAIRRNLPSLATKLIEQCMLEANEVVARHLVEHQLPALYRVHDPPPGDALEQLALHLWNAGIQVKPDALEKPGGLTDVLKRIETHPAREQLELMVLKSLSQAVYRATCDGHYALAAPFYAHFTSPIRRYPDLLVHRALKAWLVAGKKKPAVPPMPKDAGAHLSAFERIAADTEGQVIRLYRVLYMEPRVGEDFAAKVTGISERGLLVSLRDEFVDGFLPLDALRDDVYRFDARRNVIEGRRRQHKIGLGNRLTVKLVRADRLTQQLEFGWVAWGDSAAKPPASDPSPHRRKNDQAKPLPGM